MDIGCQNVVAKTTHKKEYLQDQLEKVLKDLDPYAYDGMDI